MRKRIEGIKQAAQATILTGDMRVRIVRALDDADAAVGRWPELGFAELAKRLARGYRTARNARPEDWRSADADELHELRKRVVIHRHQMEIVAPLWRRFGKLWLREAQRLRSRLGKYQDLLVLAGLGRSHQPLAHWH